MIVSLQDYTLCSNADLVKLLHKQIKNFNLLLKIEKKVIKNVSKTQKLSSKVNVYSLKKALLVFDIIKYIKEFDNNIDVNKIFKGAHIIIDDKGVLYDDLKNNKVLKERISSHHKENKSAKDASIQAGFVFNEVLFGKTKCKKTWFQVESHSADVKNLLPHVLDFVVYRITKKNIGQYGSSIHTESNPIFVSKKKSNTQKDESVKTNLISTNFESTEIIINDLKPLLGNDDYKEDVTCEDFSLYSNL